MYGIIMLKRYNRLQSYSLCNNMEETQVINLLSKVQVRQNVRKRYKNIFAAKTYRHEGISGI